jgi:hypothetical protein
MKTIVIAAALLLLAGCATTNEVQNLARCRGDSTCSTSVPGSGYGPPHQSAIGSTTGELPPH